ncbi:hypothetical protein GCM10020370_65450 [Paenibacillus hodogayensis]
MPTICIYLFGSYLNGEYDKDSDVDLYIVTNSNERKIDILKKIRKRLIEKVNIPLDLVISDSVEFSKKSQMACTFEYMIKNEGIKLYE